MYDPIGIPLDRLNENEGTISFVVHNSNLFDKNIPNIRILELAKGNTVFILERDYEFNLKFIQSNPNYGTKIAKINIQEFIASKELFIAFTWSEKENILYVGDRERGILRKARSVIIPTLIFRMGRDGHVYQIGDEGIQIGYYRVKVGNRIILEPTAKEIFDFQMEKIKILIDNCKKGDFLFESTLVQQIIVMLTTAFETYTKTRFIELEKEGKPPNMENLYNRFVSRRYKDKVREEIREISKEEGKTELEVFVSKRHINFQNWEDFKDAYNKGYGVKVGQIGVPNDILVEIQKFIKWRHKIVHSKEDQTIINFENVPPAEPIFTNKELAERGLYIFKEFINKFHEYTLK